VAFLVSLAVLVAVAGFFRRWLIQAMGTATMRGSVLLLPSHAGEDADDECRRLPGIVTTDDLKEPVVLLTRQEVLSHPRDALL
jgi:hypothetical protein